MTIPSGYGEKYRAEFTSASTTGVNPLSARKFRMSFFRNGYTGNVTELWAGAEPYTLSLAKEGMTGVVAIRANFELISSNDIPLSEFYADDELDMFVVVYEGATLTNLSFVGWLTPYNAKQPYQGGKFKIDLSAQCGLGMLNDFDYDYPPALDTVHNIVYNCLLKIGYELPLWKASAIYEEQHLINGALPGLSYDAWMATKFDTQVFFLEGKRTSCLQVLERFVPLGFVLLQINGTWRFAHWPTLCEYQTSVTWICYANASDYNPTSITIDPRKSVRSDQTIKPIMGSQEIIEPAIKQQETTFQYGNPVNLIRNGYFIANLSNWTINTNPKALTPVVVGDGSVDEPYAVRIIGDIQAVTNTDVEEVKYTFLLFGWVLRSTVTVRRTTRPIGGPTRVQIIVNEQQQIINLSVGYVNRQCRGPIAVVQAETSSGRYYLTNDGKWTQRLVDAQLTTDSIYKTINGDVQSRPTLGEVMKITSVDVVPGLGDYSITVLLYQGARISGPNKSALIEYRYVELTTQDTTSIIANKELINVQVSGLDSRARKKKETYTLLIGDQTSALAGDGIRANALRKVDTSPTVVWYQRLNGTLKKDKFQNHLTRDVVRMHGQFTPGFEGTVQGEPGPLDLPRFLELGNRIDIIKNWQWSARSRMTRISTYKQIAYSKTLKIRASWVSENGVPFPMPQETATYENTPPNTTPPAYTPRQNTASNQNSMGMLSAIQRSLQLIKVQGVVVQSNPSPNSPIAGYITNDTGTIVQTEPPLWLLLSSQNL